MFGLVLWHINYSRLFNAKSSLYIYIKYIWFGLVLRHINHCRLFNALSFLYIYIKYYTIWFCLVLWHINHCRLNPLYINIYSIYMIWFGLLLWHINHCRLFNAKYSLWIGSINFGTRLVHTSLSVLLLSFPLSRLNPLSSKHFYNFQVLSDTEWLCYPLWIK